MSSVPGTLDTFIEIAGSLNVPVEEQYREVLRWKGILDRFGQDGRTKIEVSSEVQVLRGQLGGLTADLRTAFFEQVSFSKRESRRRKINDLESQIEAVQRKLDGQIPLRPEPPTTPAEVAREPKIRR